jgi:hypothetical protein
MAARIGDRSEPRKRMEPSTPVAMAAPKLDPLLEAQVRQMGPQEKVGVRVYLTDASAATLAALQKAGLVVAAQPGGGLLVIGEIAAGRVAELSRLGMVKRVALR